MTVWIVSPLFHDTPAFVRLRAEVADHGARAGIAGPIRHVIIDDSAGADREVDELRGDASLLVLTPPFNLGHQRAIVFGLRHLAPLVAGDALHLPFADGAFDAITISFGLRNVVRTSEALREMARVVRPGGRLVVCEFSRPTWAPFGKAYYDGALRVIRVLAKKASSNPDAYVYLAESIKAWPDQEALAGMIDGAGWSGARWPGGVPGTFR